jgi:anti-anti-sigma factor
MPSQRRSRLTVETVGDATVVRFNDSRLDESNVEAVGEQLDQLVARWQGRQLRLDLANVEYLTGRALGKLVAVQKRVRAGRGRLTLENAGPLAYEVFRVTRLTTVLDVRQQAGGEAPGGSASA